MAKKWIPLVKNILKVALILLITTGLSFLVDEFGFRVDTILLLYVAGILLINLATRSLSFGMISSVISVLIFNFFFIEPRYTLMISDPNYYMSIAIFFVVAFIINTLSSRLQKQMIASTLNESRINTLYEMSKTLLNLHSIDEIAKYEAELLQKYFGRRTAILLQMGKKTQPFGDSLLFPWESHETELEWCSRHFSVCGHGEEQFPELTVKLFPFKIKSAKQATGLIVIDCGSAPLSKEEQYFIEMNTRHLMLSLEREVLATQKELSALQIEKEKIKSSLLSSISHDLRTPLTGLSTGSSYLIDNYDAISDGERKNLLADFNNETLYLAEFVENLLNLTRIDSNKLVVSKKPEIIEDLLSEILTRIRGRLGKHKMTVKSPDAVLFVDCDSQLLMQVLINLIDNAIRHTREDCQITIGYYVKNNKAVFEISDDGGGIPEEKISRLFRKDPFDQFENADKSKGSGLGLTITQAIVEAHGGTIHAFNNEAGGATFVFNIPYREEGE
jgi:two-component system sensor histidine kinase KdpD